jgi:3-oxoacyl-[acyl-carrier protein] reductase
MMKEFNGQIALVSGGSRGIGKAIVQALAEQGAEVWFTFHSSEQSARELEESVAQAGGCAKGRRVDGASFAEVEAFVNEVLQSSGKLDILVNNAGITRDNLLLRMDEAAWDAVIDNNLKSVFSFTKQALKHMLRAKSGRIINISSIVGIKGQAGQANYAASKAGIIGFTKSVADEVGSRNITCNAIAPGFIETDMTHGLDEQRKKALLEQIPLRRLGKAEDIAHTVVFLASSRASYISGQVIGVCGGLNR